MSKIGRNDLCPCGSGKKYKHCCLIKEGMSTDDLIKNAVKTEGYKKELADVICNLINYMQREQWWGACHASCSALYVAICELGYFPKLCIGEMMGCDLFFDHSWIELDGKIIDIAISMTLLNGTPISEPILFSKGIRSGREPEIIYGYSGCGIEGDALLVKTMPFANYMDHYPNEQSGLWGVVEYLLAKKISIETLREKYKDVERTYVRANP